MDLSDAPVRGFRQYGSVPIEAGLKGTYEVFGLCSTGRAKADNPAESERKRRPNPAGLCSAGEQAARG
jgi:hypothetical protein